jgi:hypothetical protein
MYKVCQETRIHTDQATCVYLALFRGRDSGELFVSLAGVETMTTDRSPALALLV